MSKKVFDKFDKQFLDHDSKFASEEFASICWNVTIEKQKEDGEEEYAIDASLRISDCNRPIFISIYCDKIEDIDLRIKKIEVMEKSLAELKKQMKAAKKYLKNK